MAVSVPGEQMIAMVDVLAGNPLKEEGGFQMKNIRVTLLSGIGFHMKEADKK